MKRVLLDGYVTERNEKRVVNGVETEIMTYQGDHCDEYLVREVGSGRCSLFYKGILKLSWKEVNGIRTDGFTVYEKGKALRSEDWNGLTGKEHRYIENCRHGLELVVEGNGVVYRGGFDDMELMKREGRGIEFDEKSGRVLRCGVWKNDELFQISQEFESEEVMIEYAIEEEESNLNVLKRHPVYEGGYVFDEEKREVLRNGYGCEIDVNTGIAVREGKWERGLLINSTELFNGWYVRREEDSWLEWMEAESCDKQTEVKESWEEELALFDLDIHDLSRWSTDERMEVFVISSKCCNGDEWKVLDVSELKWLKSIEIGDECFEKVNEVKLIGLNQLESIVIGQNSFTEHKFDIERDPDRHFYLRNCERMRELKIGRYSFSDYSVCEIENLPSLEVIRIGDLNYDSGCFPYASLELKSDSQRVK